MIKVVKKGLVLFLGIFLMNTWMAANPVFSEMSNYELEKEIKALKEQLKERESILDQINKFKILGDRLSFSGLIEIEANVGDNFDGDDESDIVLATRQMEVAKMDGGTATHKFYHFQVV